MDTHRFLTFYQSFNRVVKDIKKKEMSYMKEYGLRSVHMSCLLLIDQNDGGMTVTELARVSGTDKSLISRTVKELTANGFIKARTGGEDRSYNKKYYLTEKSQKIASDINNDIGEYMAQARIGIPDEDMQGFYEVLASLTHNISLIVNDEQ